MIMRETKYDIITIMNIHVNIIYSKSYFENRI